MMILTLHKMIHGNMIRLIFFIIGHPHVFSHREVVRATAVLSFDCLILATDTRVLVYLTGLFVFIEDRLCCRIIYAKLISCAPN